MSAEQVPPTVGPVVGRIPDGLYVTISGLPGGPIGKAKMIRLGRLIFLVGLVSKPAANETIPFTGHIRCYKCGGCHWIGGPCKPNNSLSGPGPAAGPGYAEGTGSTFLEKR